MERYVLIFVLFSANVAYKAVVAAASCFRRACGSGSLLVGRFVETQMVSGE
jgi:hypothetical protein